MDLKPYFKKAELIPAIIVDDTDGTVLMLAYMNEESLRRTMEAGYTWFWSRSRQELWNKGATSGHTQKVVSITADCDDDTLLIRVHQTGPACHTGSRSCFFKPLWQAEDERKDGQSNMMQDALESLYAVVSDRKANPQEGSYTCYLFEKGLDKILKKCGEECSETIIAAKNHDPEELKNEISDLLYHLTVLMVNEGLPLSAVEEELTARSRKIGNLKQFHVSDHNT